VLVLEQLDHLGADAVKERTLLPNLWHVDTECARNPLFDTPRWIARTIMKSFWIGASRLMRLL
jgi:hypothetical protein